MPIQRAITAYRIERLNCAQSVLRAFQPHMDLPEDAIRQAKNLGHGRADGGRCGALHAALTLTSHEATQGSILETFVARAGAETCLDIRRKKTLNCTQCVALAAALLIEHRENTKKSEPGCP